MSTDYLDHMQDIANEDVEGLKEAHNHYGRSCLKRGGSGLYHAFARKMDRLEESAKKFGYDVFAAIQTDTRAEGIIDDIRDLRRYLIIVEAEARAMQLPAAMTKQRDNVQSSKPGLFRPGDVEKIAEILSPFSGMDPAPSAEDEGVVHIGAMRDLIVNTYQKFTNDPNIDPYTETVAELAANNIKVSRNSVKRTIHAHNYGYQKTTEPPPASPPYNDKPLPRMVPRRVEQESPFGYDPEQDAT